MDPRRRRLLAVLGSHRAMLSRIGAAQCSVAFTKAVVGAFYERPMSEDVSDRLMGPILDYRFFQLPDLTPDMVALLLAPLHAVIGSSLDLNHPVAELFALLSTIIRFGTKLAMAAFLHTTVHLASIMELQSKVDHVCRLLVEHLVAAVILSGGLADGDGDPQQIADLCQEVRRFWGLGRELGVPHPLVEALIVAACRAIDAVFFNGMIVGDEVFTMKRGRELAQKMKALQEIFDCVAQHFATAFSALLNLISIIERFTGRIEASQIGPPDPLARHVVERCWPRVVLPPSVSWERIGPVPADGDSLRAERTEFQFSFEWLLSVTPPPWASQ
jgi:hypothetical protein